MNEAAAIKRQLLNFARRYLVVGERGLSLHQSDWGHFSPKHNISAPMLEVVNQFCILDLWQNLMYFQNMDFFFFKFIPPNEWLQSKPCMY